MQPGDVPATHADVSALGAYAGYEPKVGIDTGIKKFTDWYLKYYRK